MKQHSPRFLTYVAQVKKQIKEITPFALKKLIDSQSPLHLIDVRETEELSSGRIQTAIHLSKGVIERDIEKLISDPQSPIYAASPKSTIASFMAPRFFSSHWPVSSIFTSPLRRRNLKW